jgi:hypothetical protein
MAVEDAKLWCIIRRSRFAAWECSELSWTGVGLFVMKIFGK